MPTGEGADLVAWEHALHELGKVKPLVGGATARAEVEVEGVNVEEGEHDALPKCKGRPFRNGPAPFRRSYRGR